MTSIIVRVKDIVYPGRGIAKDESGKVIFVDGGIDGELVEVKVYKRHKSYDEAVVEKVIEPSPLRREANCNHWQVCSPYQIMDYRHQIRLKLRQLANILKPICSQKIEAILPGKVFNYRNKAIFHIDWDSNKLGYKQLEEGVLDIDSCSLLDKNIDKLIPQLKALIFSSKLKIISKVGIRVNRAGQLLLLLFLDPQTDGEIGLSDIEFFLGIKNLVGIVRIKGKSVRAIYGRDWLEEEINSSVFRYYANGFFQVNYEMAEQLALALKKEVIDSDARVVADLFCGVGFLGLSIADVVRWIYAVELDPTCKKALEVNSANNPFGNLSYKLVSCAKVVWEIFEDKSLRKKIDTVIVDPPRSGLSKSVREFLRKNAKVKNLFYVSCDPMTLRRDLVELKSVYKVKKVYFLDFFPQTPHIETLVVLTRRKK